MSQFAQTDEEAEVRYEKFKSLDPFPEIPPALLNSADIEDYVAKTGMLFPFDPSDKIRLLRGRHSRRRNLLRHQATTSQNYVETRRRI
jgi:hypothetical protein